MRSHFQLNSGAAMACVVVGAATMLNARCAAQTYLAADYSTNSIYNSGWSAGQNGGYGFGAWSFDGSDAGSTPGTMESMTTTSALGTAWTLMNPASDGIAICGRSLPGALQVGQTFQTTIQNPVNSAFFRGFDVLFTSNSNNSAAGDNIAALRLQVFQYINPAMDWETIDADGGQRTTASAITTGGSGMIIALTLNSTNTYTLNMAPVSDPNNPYFTYSGTLVGTNLPINYVNFRLWNTPSSGPADTADNFEISSMTVLGAPIPILNAQRSGANLVLSWSTNFPNFVLASSPGLTNGSVWSTNLPAPVAVGSQNYVTNPISGPQQFFRLQLVQ